MFLYDQYGKIIRGPAYHHVWCNGNPNSPVKGCRWCDGKDGLWMKYPYNTQEEVDGLAKKHFPKAIRRT